jgi:dTDP-4-dehydrorhamnose reductase
VTDFFVLLTGASGYLGHEVASVLQARGIATSNLGRGDGFDLMDTFELGPRFEAFLHERETRDKRGRRPLLVHVAAMARPDACQKEPDIAFRVNAEATGALSSVLRRRDGRVVYVSTDLVFDGEHAPYDERSEAWPLSIYGKSKLAGERMVLTAEHALVVRLPLLYGPSADGQRGPSDPLLATLRAAQSVKLFTDEWRTPLHVRQAAERLVDLAMDARAEGVRHLPGPERLTRFELGTRLAEAAGLPADLCLPALRAEHQGAPRAKDCSLATLF